MNLQFVVNTIKERICVRKRLFLFSLVLLLIVSSSAWAAVPQEEAIANTSTSTVGELPILRGEFAALLVKTVELEGEGEPTDILIQHGIMKGVPGKKADADRPIQRVEAATLVGRALGLTDSVIPPADTDISLPADHWAYGSYAWLTRLGLVAGDPTAVLSQNEGAALVKNAFQPTTEEVLAILQESQTRSKSEEAARVRVALNGKVRLLPRPGVEGAEEIPSFLAPELHMIQEMVLPNKIHQITTIELTLPELGAQKMVMESYLVDGKMYQQMPDPETGKLRWFKYPEGMMPDMQKLIEQAQQQTQVIPPGLEETLFYKLLGTQERNGEQVYEIAYYGRVDDMAEFMSTTLGSLGEGELLGEAFGATSSIIDSISFWGITYVGADDYLTRQANFGALVTYAAEFQGQPMPLQAVEILMTTDEYSYGKDIDVTVPEEVLAAPELEIPEPQPEPELPSDQ